MWYIVVVNKKFVKLGWEFIKNNIGNYCVKVFWFGNLVMEESLWVGNI